MATGASTADLAVVLIDARQGILRQTRRHSIIASLLGIRHIALAVNKFDLVDIDRAVFDRITAEYRAFAAELGFETIEPIPMSARFGDNVTSRSASTPWYQGPTLLEHLESVAIEESAAEKPFRFPVQYVNRPNLDFRGFAGTIASGSMAQGDAVVVAKSGRTSRVARIVTQDGDLPRAVEGQAVTLVLDDEIEVSRGNMLVAPEVAPACGRPSGRQARLVRRGRVDARPFLYPAHRNRPDQRHRDDAAAPHQCQRLRPRGGKDARHERGRRGGARTAGTDCL